MFINFHAFAPSVINNLYNKYYLRSAGDNNAMKVMVGESVDSNPTQALIITQRLSCMDVALSLAKLLSLHKTSAVYTHPHYYVTSDYCYLIYSLIVIYLLFILKPK